MSPPDNPFRARRNSHNAIGIKGIAKALGVSIGTVDRALHDRPGINPITRAKVLTMAQTMGYKPNLAARFLKSSRQLRISVHLPLEIASFFDALRDGIREAAAPFEPAVHIQFRSYARLGEGDVELFEEALQDGSAGLIIAPGKPAAVKPLIRKAARARIPVVCVSTDAPGTERLTAVSADPYINGAVVAELMARMLRGPGRLAIETGSLSTEDHAEKVHGFRETLRSIAPEIGVAAVLESHDEEREAYRQTAELLRDVPDLCGIYVSTANSLPVLQAVEEAGLARRPLIVTTDLFPALVPLIRSGRVTATVHQRPWTQGRRAFQALYEFLVAGRCPPPRIRFVPHIVFNSNLDLFLDQFSGQEAGAEEPEFPLWSAEATRELA